MPKVIDHQKLREIFSTIVTEGISNWVSPDQPHYALQLNFTLGRLDEGERVAAFFANRLKKSSASVLDLGAGNGGISAAFSNRDEFDVTAIDLVPNAQLRRLRDAAGLQLKLAVGSGHDLPFKDESFDVVVCLETLEHVARPQRLGREVMRVLKPDGVAMITTPARLHWLFKKDPHYGIRGLYLLPDRWQEWLVKTIFSRRFQTFDGAPVDVYDVVHTFWHVAEVAQCFPQPHRVDVLYLPEVADSDSPFMRVMRDWFWDRILIHKSEGLPIKPFSARSVAGALARLPFARSILRRRYGGMFHEYEQLLRSLEALFRTYNIDQAAAGLAKSRRQLRLITDPWKLHRHLEEQQSAALASQSFLYSGVYIRLPHDQATQDAANIELNRLSTNLHELTTRFLEVVNNEIRTFSRTRGIS